MFNTQDAALEWQKSSQKAYFTAAWDEGTSVNTPSEVDYIQRETFGYFFFAVKDLHEYPQPIAISMVLPHLQARCYVCHTPVNGNFWHFSVRWKVGADDVEDALTKNERRDLLGLVKVFLKTKAIVDAASVNQDPIPQAWYSTP